MESKNAQSHAHLTMNVWKYETVASMHCGMTSTCVNDVTMRICSIMCIIFNFCNYSKSSCIFCAYLAKLVCLRIKKNTKRGSVLQSRLIDSPPPPE